MTKVFITKYALTNGIQEVEVVISQTHTSMCFLRGDLGRYDQIFSKPDWHLTLEEAKTQAESMRQKKIVSLKKQLAKLEKLKF